jgi:TonB-linked SusC/RagA family outer membrane protein
MKIYTFLLILLFSCNALLAQQMTITGVVTSDDDKLPIPGASITIVNSSVSTITDYNGNFSIKAKKGDVLRITYIGFRAKGITIDQQRTLKISLIPVATALDEVAVVGYGTQKKVDVTGAVQTYKLDSLVNIPVTNTAQLMYGRFSGVQITQDNGLPGTDNSSINIRGLGTFGNSVPLVVIDGMQFEDLTEFNRLAPSDVSSITVLKDASSVAIYGARGANGVIVITTKQGSSDSFKIEYSNYVGSQSPTFIPKFLNAINYATLINEKFRNEANGAAFNPRYTDDQIQLIKDGSQPYLFANTDWASIGLKNATVQNHFLAASGGKGGTTYRISLGYLDQDAIVQGKFKAQRYNFRINLNSKLKDWITIGNNFNGSYQKTIGPNGGLGRVEGIIASFATNAPTIPLYTETGGFGSRDGAYGNINFSLGGTNVLRGGVNGDYFQNDTDLSDRLFASIKIIKNLTFEPAITLSAGFIDNSDFRPINLDENDLIVTTTVNNLVQTTKFDYRVLAENLLKYNAKYKKNVFTFLAGYSTIYAKNSNFSASLSNFPTSSLPQFDAGGTLNPKVSGTAAENALQSIFGRFNYSLDGKYLLGFSYRRDGSSKFGPENKYASFPAISAGWKISDEDFMKNIMKGNVLTFLKLRANWGRSGINGIDNYLYSQSYDPGLDYILGTSNTIVSGVGKSVYQK